MTFYIAVVSSQQEQSLWLDSLSFYTRHKELMDRFLLQNKLTKFDIYEIEGDNIIEVSEEFNHMPNITRDTVIDTKLDELTLYTSHSFPDISFVSSQNYIDMNIEAHNMFIEDLCRLLVSAYTNVMKLLPYLVDTKDLKSYLQFVYMYILRLIIVLNCDIYSLPKDELTKLGLNKSDVFFDIVDENLIYYMQEFGWGDSKDEE